MSATKILHAEWQTVKEITELRMVLDRAMNTWEPKDQPEWLGRLSAKVDEMLCIAPAPSLGMRDDRPA